MKRLSFLIALLFGIVFLSCEKDDPEEQIITAAGSSIEETNFFISGTYFEEYGDSSGIANAEIVLEAEDDFGVPVIVGLDTTDENGCFRIDYEKLERNELTLSVRWIDPNSITNPLNGFRYQCLPGDTVLEAIKCYDKAHFYDVDLTWKINQNVTQDTLYLMGKGIINDTIDFGSQGLCTGCTRVLLQNRSNYNLKFSWIHNKNQCSGINFTRLTWFVGKENLPVSIEDRNTPIDGQRGFWKQIENGSLISMDKETFEVYK